MHDQDNSHASMSTPSNCQNRTKKEDTSRFKKGSAQSAGSLREMSPEEPASSTGGHLSTNRAVSKGGELIMDSINEERNNVNQKFSVDGENSVTYNEAITSSLKFHDPGDL